MISVCSMTRTGRYNRKSLDILLWMCILKESGIDYIQPHILQLATRFYSTCTYHANPLIRTIRRYTLQGLKTMYKTYINTRGRSIYCFKWIIWQDSVFCCVEFFTTATILDVCYLAPRDKFLRVRHNGSWWMEQLMINVCIVSLAVTKKC
jgi:hypothetical protein